MCALILYELNEFDSAWEEIDYGATLTQRFKSDEYKTQSLYFPALYFPALNFCGRRKYESTYLSA